MTVSGMDFTQIIDDCLERLAHGESVEACLARYPGEAEKLAPILLAARELRVLSQARLTDGQRLRAKVSLRKELAARRGQREQTSTGMGLWRGPRFQKRAWVAPLAALVAVLLFVSVAFSAVASSQPGDLAYPVRVAVERAPALVQTNPARGAAAELAAAERRLSDIALDDGVHPVAVTALLASDEAAVARSQALGEAEQAEIAGRVAAHADALARLANRAVNAQIAGRLQAAADEARALAGGSKSIVTAPAPTQKPATAASSTRSATVPAAGGPVTAVASATAGVAPSATLRVQPTPTGSAGGTAPGATPRPRPRLSVTPQTPTLTPAPAESTARPRPTLPVVPPQHTARPRPTLSVPAPTVVVPVMTRQPRPTLSTAPTRAAPTAVVPTASASTPEATTATPGAGASFTTATPTPGNALHASATVGWSASTPGPAFTP